MGTKRIPESSLSVEQVGEEIIRRISEVAAAVPTVTLVWNDQETEVVKGNQYRASVWLHGPAMLELMSNAFRRLLKVAAETKTDLAGNPLDLAGKHIAKVRAARAKGKKTVYIVPTSDEDILGLPVNMDKSSAYINLITILSPAKMTVATGYRERYEAEYAESGKDPIYPALKISLVNPLERRKTSKGKAEEETEATGKTKATKATSKAGPTTEPSPAAPAPAPQAGNKTDTPK